MRLYLSQPCYKWLVQLKILKAYMVPQQSISHVMLQQSPTNPNQNPRRYEICYDDQLYLENGYLVGVLMREILKAHQLCSDRLLRVRKITVLKQDENWAIVREVLEFLDFPFEASQQQQYLPEEKEIQRILEFLFDQYGPLASTRKDPNRRYFHLQPSIIHPQYEKNRLKTNLDGVSAYSFSHCNNLLEYSCFIIHKSFDYQLQINECMGLLIDRGKHLKKIIIHGLSEVEENDSEHEQSSFQAVSTMYKQILNSTTRFDELLVHEPGHLDHFMEIFATGVLSQSEDVAKLACLLIETIDDDEWFITHGVSVMVCSEWPEVLNLIINKAKGCFRQVFNEELEALFGYEQDFLSFLIRFLPVLAKSLHSKQVLEHLQLPYLLQRATATFDPDDVSSSEPRIRNLSREVITLLFRLFFRKIPQMERTRACIAFELNPYSPAMSLWETFVLLGNLFELIKVFLVNEDATVEKYFRIALKYLRAKETDVREMVIENLKYLYFTMKKSFPLGAFLTAYEGIVVLNPVNNNKQKKTTNTSFSPIAQHFDFDFLLAISKDQSLVEEEVLKTLNTTLEYFLQINGDCFLQVILNLLKFKESSEWCASISEQILSKWTQIKLPPLIESVYKRKSPQEMCRFEAFGVKRREILKFQEYQKYKLLLEGICQLRDGGFLREYRHNVQKKVHEINREKELVPYNIFLKKLLQKIRLSRTLLPEPIELASKSLIYLTQGMTAKDSIARGLEEANEGDEMRSEVFGQNESGFMKLRDEATESPIHRNRKQDDSTYRKEHNVSNGQKDPGTDEELNEFLQTRNKTLKSNIGSSIQSEKIANTQKFNNQFQPYEPLRPFTEQQPQSVSQLSDMFIHAEQMQQFELTYIKIQKENNPALIEACIEIYLQSFLQTDPQTAVVKFLTGLGIKRQLAQKEAVILWREVCRVHLVGVHNSMSLQLSPQQARQVVWQLLVQYSFLMFGFKRNTRTRVKLIEIFLKLLGFNLAKNEVIKTVKTVQFRPQTIIKRQMTFENKLISGKFLKWNPQYDKQYLKGHLFVPKNPLKHKKSESKQQIASRILESHQTNQNSKSQSSDDGSKRQDPKFEMKKVDHNFLQSWLVSFEILNDIVAQSLQQKSLGLGLIEPISKITTSVLPGPMPEGTNSDTNKQQQQLDSKNQSNQGINDQKDQLIELGFLQQQLQRLENTQVKTKSPKLKKLTKSIKTQPDQGSQQTQPFKPKTRPPRLEYSTKHEQRLPTVSFSKISASQLQQKIKSRKDQLKQEIKTKKMPPAQSQQNPNHKAPQQLQFNKKKNSPEKISYNIDS